MKSSLTVSAIIFLSFLIVLNNINLTHCWKYQTKCTQSLQPDSASPLETKQSKLSNSLSASASSSFSIESYLSKIDDLNADSNIIHNSDVFKKVMHLKCPNVNDFLFIGLTQYGVSSSSSLSKHDECHIGENDCLVTVDYLSNECNGLNSCDIQLDSQFLHTCKNNSDYLSVAYECIPGAKRLDVCSNDELYIIDPFMNKPNDKNDDLISRFGSFYLSTPNYPNEYNNDLNNCSCRINYVHIDNNNNNDESNDDTQNEINLVFKTFEFDMEEGETNYQHENSIPQECNKDYLKIESQDLLSKTNASFSLCGQYKEFKEFYSKGNNFKLNFTTNDVISRRGFLIRISPTTDVACPPGTQRFNNEKCLKYFDDQLNWFDASKSCQALDGELLKIDDFVDNLKLNSLISSNLVSSPFWSSIDHSIQPNKNKYINYLNIKLLNKTNSLNDKRCFTKKFNHWQEEKCLSKHGFICEFNTMKRKSHRIFKKDASNNKLIRVACGTSSTTLFSSSFKQSSSSTSNMKPTAQITTTNKFPTKIKSNSIKNTQLPSFVMFQNFPTRRSKLARSTTKSLRFKAVLNSTSDDSLNSPIINSNDDYDFPNIKINEETKNNIKSAILKNVGIEDEKEKLKTTTLASNKLTYFGQDLVFIIAIAGGALIVLMAINIFCVWNYYNKKLKRQLNKTSTYRNDGTYRTSTLIRPKNTLKSTSSSSADSHIIDMTTNRTITSTVDSYSKVPTYEVCVNLNTNEAACCESLSTTSSADSAQSALLLTNEFLANNENKIEFLKKYFEHSKLNAEKNLETTSILNQQHYYETLSANSKNIYLNSTHYPPNWISSGEINPNQNQILLLPATSQGTSSTLGHQATVVILASQQLQNQLMQKQQQQQYSTIYGEVSPSSSVSSTQPLLTFVNNNNNNNT